MNLYPIINFLSPRISKIQTVAERIKQRRYQMLLYSYRYYHLDKPTISDDQWQQWADELVELHKVHQNIGFYDNEFKDWNGSTGHYLPVPNHIKKLHLELCG